MIRLAISEDALEAVIENAGSPGSESNCDRELIDAAIKAGECLVNVASSGEINSFIVTSVRSFFDRDFVRLLVVSARHRRTGIGSALLAAATLQATSDVVFTSTNESNGAMCTLLTHEGWTYSGTLTGLDEGDSERVLWRERLPRPDTEAGLQRSAAVDGVSDRPVLRELVERGVISPGANWVDVVNAVAAIPYGRALGPTPADVLSGGRGTCSSKHYLLAQSLREGWPELSVTVWHRVYRLTPERAELLFGPRVAAAVPRDGLVDVHTYLRVDSRTGPLAVDVTFPLGEPWDASTSMPLRCVEGVDVEGGAVPARTKDELVRRHCDPTVREPFIASLTERSAGERDGSMAG